MEEVKITNTFRNNETRRQRGAFLLEMLVAVSIAAVILTAASDMMLNNVQKSYDTEIILETEVKARAILDLMTFDLRMLGAGIPFNQSGFKISDATVGDSALPIYTDSSSDYLHFKLNELGKDAFIISTFQPDTQNSITVDSTLDFADGDVIYISDATAGGNDGLQATITSVNYPHITLGSKIFLEGSTFPAGSLINRVVALEYSTPNIETGIIRNNGYGDIVLSPRSGFSVSYLDKSGNALRLPLSSSQIANELLSINLTVSVNSKKPLKDGSEYTARSTGKITIRSLKN